MVYVLAPMHPSESVAVIVKVNRPVAVGVPESIPSDCKVRPSGNERTVWQSCKPRYLQSRQKRAVGNSHRPRATWPEKP